MMNNNNPEISRTPVEMAWYKVPILWLMISLLGFTVISGVVMFSLAHDTLDSIVIEKNYAPLNKKQALPNVIISNKLKTI